jgi:hypothetical protein
VAAALVSAVSACIWPPEEDGDRGQRTRARKREPLANRKKEKKKIGDRGGVRMAHGKIIYPGPHGTLALKSSVIGTNAPLRAVV